VLVTRRNNTYRVLQMNFLVRGIASLLDFLRRHEQIIVIGAF